MEKLKMEVDVNYSSCDSCFICLQAISLNINNSEELINSTNLFFKYLKIKDEIQAFVCANCGENLTRFVKLCRNLEKVRLEMDYLLDSIKSVILDSNKSKLVYSGVVTARQLILEKRIEDVMNPKPRIILERMDTSGEGDPFPTFDCSNDYLPSCDSDLVISNVTGAGEAEVVGKRYKEVVGKRLRKTRKRKPKILPESGIPSESKLIKKQSQTPAPESDDHDWSPPNSTSSEDDATTPVIQETVVKSGRKLKKGSKSAKARRIHPAPEKAKCPTCSKTFYSRQTMQDHVNAVHLKLKPFKCPECPKFFSDKRSLKSHLSNIHSSIKPYKCDICDKSFAKPSFLKNHKEYHKPKLPCTKCSKTFPNAQRLKRHDNMVHLRLKPFKCSECPRAFAQGCHLRYHNKIAHLGFKPDKSHMCEECGKAFASSTALNLHKSTPHNLPPPEFLIPKKFSCEKCLSTFITAAKLKIHKRVIHPPPHKMFPCDICKKTFKTGVLLRLHVSSIHEKQRHHCQVEGCDDNYSTPTRLRDHYKLKHPDFVKRRPTNTNYTKIVVDEQFVFECNICSIRFKTADSVRAHVRFVHGPKTFLCQECGYSAAKKGNLDKHVKKYHSKIKIDEMSL